MVIRTEIIAILALLIICIVVIHITLNYFRKEFDMYDKAGGELYKRIRKRCLVLGCKNKAEIFFGWRAGICKECYNEIFGTRNLKNH